MTINVVDLIKIKVLSTGTGALSLGDAVAGYRGLEGLTNGLEYSYSIQQGADYEIGKGTYLATGNLLVRSPSQSSNGGAALDLQPNATVAFVLLAADLQQIKQGPAGTPGPAGPAGNVAATLADLKAAPITNVTMLYDQSTWTWTEGDYSGTASDQIDVNVVFSDDELSSVGAWIRQLASKVALDSGKTMQYFVDLLTSAAGAGATGAADGATVQANLDHGGSAIQPQIGAVRRKTQDKNLGFVDVRDYMTDADRASVEAGTLVDTSYAFQAAFDACSGKSSASTQFGRKLRIPAGRYLINSSVLFTWRNTDAIVDAGDHRKLTIEGDGSANTVIFCNVGTGIAFDIQGYGNADGTKLDLSIHGLSIFEQSLGTSRTGTGLRTKQATRVWLNDVVINYFNIGYNFGDAIYVGAVNCEFGGNNGGAVAAVDAFSNPNVITFFRCNFGGNQVYGLQTTAAANLHVLNCAFEGIGTDNTAGADQACIHLINGPVEGGHQATIANCYFENNQVYADIRVEWNSTNRGTLTMAANSFRRTDSTRFSTRHIAMSQVSTGNMYVNLDNNSYKASGTYTPGSNPCWEVLSTPVLIDARNEQYISSELPALNGIPALRNCGLEIIAEGFVNADGTTTKLVNCSLSKTATGTYAVTFTKQPVDANFHVNPRQGNSFGHCSYVSASTSGVTILTSDSGGNSADKAFDFTIIGRRIS